MTCRLFEGHVYERTHVAYRRMHSQDTVEV